MTTPAPTTLRQTWQQFAQYLIDGHTTGHIRALTGLSKTVVYATMRELRSYLSCPPCSKPPVIVHYLLTAQHVTTPAVDGDAPRLSMMDQRLLQAVGTHSTSAAIAEAAGIDPRYLPGALNLLLARCQAPDTTQLVVRAHAWGLLGTGRSKTAPAKDRR
jgi:hypothetical protein